MLQNIVAHGTPEQRQQALQNIITAEALRVERETVSKEAVAIELATASAGKVRVIYNAQNGRQLPGVQVRGEGDGPTGDAAVDEAYDGAGATYDLYRDFFDRDSIDGQGLRLDSTVHYQRGYDNAFWNGMQMVYGDGDEDLPAEDQLFNRFTIAIDIIGHELTHGVTQFTAGLAYFSQSGAINESMSDVFGSLVKQRVLNQTAAEADWIIGAGLFTPNVNGVGIRSMKAPGTAYDDPVLRKDPQPGHMRDYVETSADNGGVHINSGIPNRAFYVTAVTLGGFAWERAGKIWYVTLRDKLRVNSNFNDLARLTFETAGQLYGVGSAEQEAVRAGWTDVGLMIETGNDDQPPDSDDDDTPPPAGCLPSITHVFRRFLGF
jgi:Zn-dependent metalloprotease